MNRSIEEARRRRSATGLRGLVAVAVIALGAPAGRAEVEGHVHLVIACDTNPAAHLGEAVTRDAANIGNVFSGDIPPAMRTITSIPTEQMNPQGILDAIDALPVAAGTDIVVFYYSGHGAYNPQMGPFLDLPERGTLRRSAIHQAIQRKGPKLAVVLTDCCYALKPRRQVQAYTMAPGAPTGEPPEIVLSPLFESLLFRTTGIVDITSSKQGEISMTRDDNNGSVFTYPLVQFLRQNAQRPLSWGDVFQVVRRQVSADFKGSNPGGVDINGDGASDQFDQTAFAFNLGRRADDGAPPDGAVPPVDVGPRPPVVPPPDRTGPVFGARGRDNGGEGVQITEVVPGSPAARAGLEANDVILEIDGQAIDSEAAYSDAVDRAGAVMQMRLRNWRDGQIYTADVNLNR
jgi:hypothetical protein